MIRNCIDSGPRITERIWLRYASPKFPFGELQIRRKRYAPLPREYQRIAGGNQMKM